MIGLAPREHRGLAEKAQNQPFRRTGALGEEDQPVLLLLLLETQIPPSTAVLGHVSPSIFGAASWSRIPQLRRRFVMKLAAGRDFIFPQKTCLPKLGGTSFHRQ